MDRPPLHRRSLTVLCAVYLSFGAPIGMLGAGWPEARHLFDRSAGSLGLVAAAYGFGRLVTAPTAVPVLRRWRMGPATAVLGALLAASALATALTRSFPVLVVTFAVIGLTSGGLDSLGNRYQTVVRDVGSAGMMFGSYGVGATLGPMFIAVVGWTPAFVASAVLAIVAAGLAASGAVAWPAGLRADDAAHQHHPHVHVPGWVIGLSLALFGIYCALEVTTATWGASYLEGSHDVSEAAAAWTMSGFWAGMTLGRMLMGRLAGPGRPLDARQLLVGSAAAATAVFLLLPVAPAPGAVALVVVAGVALAALFPTLMTTTADRVGVRATGRVMGWQLLSANVSELALSALVGVLVNQLGMGTVAVTLALLSVVGLPLLVWSTSIHAPDAGAGTGTGPPDLVAKRR